MIVPFTKMHGAANDYIYINCLDGLPVGEQSLPDLARAVSERHRGIGSDGMILILPPRTAEAQFGFRMFNSDGSEGEMCGNGMRCFARYVVARGLTERLEFWVDTLAGLIQCWVEPADLDQPWRVTCDLGSPRLLAAEVPTELPTDERGIVRDHPYAWQEHVLPMTAVSTGVPHAVIFLDHPATVLPWRTIGRDIETASAFPRRTNVEFAHVRDRATVEVSVWERGSGETLACGTGACAVVVAGVLTGRLERQATVRLAGGDLTVHWRQTDGHVLLSGPAVEVCRGEFVMPGGA